MNHGRPSKPTQIKMQKDLRKYFEYGISATIAAEKIGINAKTASKYFEEWAEQITETESADFFERQKKERNRIIVSLDLLIIELHGLHDEINSRIEKLVKQDKSADHLYGTKLAVIKFISELIEKKTAFAMKPIMTEALKSEIDKMREDAKT